MNPTMRQVRMLNELIWKTSLVNTMKRTVIQITVERAREAATSKGSSGLGAKLLPET